MTDCGASGESCCTSLAVTSGTFYRTYENTGDGATNEADPATISTFQLDKYDVTVGRFRQFVMAWDDGAGWQPPVGSGKHTHLNGGRGLVNEAAPPGYETGWMPSDDGSIAPTDANLACETTGAGAEYFLTTWTSTAGGQEGLPINCVNWYEAYAFCIWDGAFLPSEAEWEYAATGGSAQFEYPWGSTAPGTASLYAIYGCFYPNGSGKCSGIASIAPVGMATKGAGPWGQLDLAGNMWQWNLDWYSSNYISPCTDAAYLTATSTRVNRGGDFTSVSSNLFPSERDSASPSARSTSFGFRCARTP
jgi:formylglycine-generating enzyme required for sulfatase activity